MTGRILQLGEHRALRRQDVIVGEALNRILPGETNPVLAALVDPFTDYSPDRQSGPHHLDRVSADRSDKEGR